VERHASLDALRGLLIVSVVMGHFPSTPTGVSPLGELPDWIYYIHIPLFLALSCLFVKPITRELVRRRAVQILVPYAVWMVLTEPVRAVSDPKTFAWELLFGNWDHVRSPLWFLPALFTLNVWMMVWRWACSSPAASFSRTGVRGLMVVLSVGAFVGGQTLALHHMHIPLGLDVAPFLFPFVLLIDRVWRTRSRLQAMKRWWMALAVAMLVLGGVVIRFVEEPKEYCFFGRRVDFAQFSVPEKVPGYLGMCVMGVALFVLALRLPPPRWLQAVGRASMPIFLMHYALMIPLSVITLGFIGDSRPLLVVDVLFITAVVVVAAMFGAKFLRKLTRRAEWIGMTIW
jgi:fucose 4-O-acetylase-like acetyltransferase